MGADSFCLSPLLAKTPAVHPWFQGLFCDDDEQVAEPDANATPAHRRWMLGARCGITPCLYPAYTRPIPGSDQPPNPQSRYTRGTLPYPVRVSRFAPAVGRPKDSCISSKLKERDPSRPLPTQANGRDHVIVRALDSYPKAIPVVQGS